MLININGSFYPICLILAKRTPFSYFIIFFLFFIGLQRMSRPKPRTLPEEQKSIWKNIAARRVEDQSRTWRTEPRKKDAFIFLFFFFFYNITLFFFLLRREFNCRRQSKVNTIGQRDRDSAAGIDYRCDSAHRLFFCDVLGVENILGLFVRFGLQRRTGFFLIRRVPLQLGCASQSLRPP